MNLCNYTLYYQTWVAFELDYLMTSQPCIFHKLLNHQMIQSKHLFNDIDCSLMLSPDAHHQGVFDKAKEPETMARQILLRALHCIG